jgi:hypothetical protein
VIGFRERHPTKGGQLPNEQQLREFFEGQGFSSERAQSATQEILLGLENFIQTERPKVATTEQIAQLNNIAKERNLNRVLSDEFIEELDPNGWHLCATAFIHEHAQGESVPPHVRGLWHFKTFEGDQSVNGTLDMDSAYYMSLAEWNSDTKRIEAEKTTKASA